MQQIENQGLKAAAQMQLDNAEDIQKLDQEAMIDSDKVQSLAENMDHSLGHSLKMMRKADKGLQHSMVSKKKTAPSSLKKPTKDVPPFLGESRNTGTFKERLERVKTRVNGEVEAAQTGLDTLRASRKSMHKQEKRQIQKDHRIIAAMTTAKTLLDQDLKGHEDKRLEKDIEREASKMPHSSRLGESNSKLPPGLKAAEDIATLRAATLDKNANGATLRATTLDKNANGANPRPHRAATGAKPIHHAAAEPVPSVNHAAEPIHHADQGTDTIKNDAKKLAAYEKSALNEMSKQGDTLEGILSVD